MKIEVTHQDMYEKGYREGYGKAMYEMEQKGMLREWIPCSERLPEEDDLTQVLASVNERYALYKIILLPSRSVKTEYKLGHIDAWMELPKPYRKEASE